MAAAGLPPNPYALNFLNSLPAGFPLRHLPALESDPSGENKDSPLLMNGKRHGSLSPSRSISPVMSEDGPPGRKLRRKDVDEKSNGNELGDNENKESLRNESSACFSDEDRGEEDSDRESVDNKVQKILDTVNASVTRQLLKACNFKNENNGSDTEDEMGKGSISGEPMEDDREDAHNNNNNNNNDNNNKNFKVDGMNEERQRKKNGIEGLAARLEMCQQKKEKSLLKRDSSFDDKGYVEQETGHSSQSENEANDQHSKFFIVYISLYKYKEERN